MTQPDAPVLLGTVGAPHGIKGEVRVKSFTDDPLSLGDYGKLWTADGRTFKITRLRQQKSVLVVKFKGVNCRDEAEALNGTELFVDRSVLPAEEDEDDFYIVDLIGLQTKDPDNQSRGKILSVQNFGAGDMLEIEGMGNKSWFLEFTRANVPDIDFEAGIVTIDPPAIVSERDE